MSNENEQKPWERAANELGLLSRTPASQWPNFPVQDTIQRACQEWADHSTASLRAERERLRGQLETAVKGSFDASAVMAEENQLLRADLTAAKSQVERLREALQALSFVCTCSRPAIGTAEGGVRVPGPHTERCVRERARKALASTEPPATEQ